MGGRLTSGVTLSHLPKLRKVCAPGYVGVKGLARCEHLTKLWVNRLSRTDAHQEHHGVGHHQDIPSSLDACCDRAECHRPVVRNGEAGAPVRRPRRSVQCFTDPKLVSLVGLWRAGHRVCHQAARCDQDGHVRIFHKRGPQRHVRPLYLPRQTSAPPRLPGRRSTHHVRRTREARRGPPTSPHPGCHVRHHRHPAGRTRQDVRSAVLQAPAHVPQHGRALPQHGERHLGGRSRLCPVHAPVFDQRYHLPAAGKPTRTRSGGVQQGQGRRVLRRLRQGVHRVHRQQVPPQRQELLFPCVQVGRVGREHQPHHCTGGNGVVDSRPFSDCGVRFGRLSEEVLHLALVCTEIFHSQRLNSMALSVFDSDPSPARLKWRKGVQAIVGALTGVDWSVQADTAHALRELHINLKDADHSLDICRFVAQLEVIVRVVSSSQGGRSKAVVLGTALAMWNAYFGFTMLEAA
ncbi:hypothetical protein DAPPUDRAFT_120811 [Daphnia pulex]|uniref:Uncharacterized protein n=1 Tax=Daphnia pulex TaxID=6669 RepID=E9I291_DAPPU|nr:hypothetical protein DAPPUDRAFT_120811 [Daphnia pulex]|eukprot:EFX61889.1 hypothetical protein DAPPUDRAFT_120811 [Daphnia pulex]